MLNLNRFSGLDDEEEVQQSTPPQDDKADIERALLQKLEPALFYLFPNGETARHEFLIGSVKGEEGQSLKIELDGGKGGLWHDFATGEGGDIFSLWGQVKGWDARTQFPEILQDMRKWLGMPEAGKTQSPRKPKKKINLSAPDAQWAYHDVEGNIIAYAYRYNTGEDEKEFRPFDVATQTYHPPEPRPLYNLPGILKADNVVIVEGEKCAEALIAKGITATTAMGGAKAPLDKTDWTPLKGKHVLVWPDNDVPGLNYAERLSTFLYTQDVLSLYVLKLPDGIPLKWDAADAVEEGRNIDELLRSNMRMVKPCDEGQGLILPNIKPIPYQSLGEWLDEEHTMPFDLIEPRVLTPGGILLFGGAPKVGKTDFMLNWLIRLSAGLPFLGMNTPQPLKIFYFQSEIDHAYMRERLRALTPEAQHLTLMRQNLMITDSIRMLLDAEGMERLYHTIKERFIPDLIVIDPLRNVYPGASENDNMEMMRFLQDRVRALKDALNPDAGVILVHHTRKVSKTDITEDPFNVLSGASVLRSFYTSGMILYKPDEAESLRHLCFELRNGPPLPMKKVDKVSGHWQEMTDSIAIVRSDRGEKAQKDRQQVQDVILTMIIREAKQGKLYTPTQFSQVFEGKEGLGGEMSIRRRIDVLASQGLIKFNRSPEFMQSSNSKYGMMCVDKMIYLMSEDTNLETGEVTPLYTHVLPTHYKDPEEGHIIPVTQTQEESDA